MQGLKTSISILLILVFTIGFTHDFIPHHHEGIANINFSKQDSKEHHLMHHQHVAAAQQDADDILHENHLDDNLYDYVICLLNDLSIDDIWHIHFHNKKLDNDTQLEVQLKVTYPLIIAAANSFLNIAPKVSTLIPNYPSRNYTNYKLQTYSRRGPPFFV
jgi:hypothetical protein